MESRQAVSALEALAQEHRLAAFRALVQAGPAGLTPTRLCAALGLAAPTLSFHLAQLRHAGLVSVRREGRSLIYAAAYDKMDGLIRFLTENCCAGAACVPATRKITRKEKSHEAPSRSRRRA